MPRDLVEGWALLPAWYWLALVTLVGASVGSFLNVVIARLPAGESLLSPGSRCPGCRQAIAWYDNIPVVSFLLLRGRCRRCGQSIAWRYPLVEILMAMLSAALWLRFGWGWELALWWPMSAALLAIVFLDIDHWWVPDVITFPAMAAAWILAWAPGGLSPWQSLAGVAPAFGLWGVGWLFLRITGREGMGFGDVKLLAVIGLAVGWLDAVVVLLLASLQGAVVGILVTLTGGHRGVDDPVAPGLSGAHDDPGGGSNDGNRDPGSGDGDNDDDSDDDSDDDDDWVPPPGAFPFGPFLVLGTLQLVLLPDLFGALLPRLSQWLTGWIAGPLP